MNKKVTTKKPTGQKKSVQTKSKIVKTTPKTEKTTDLVERMQTFFSNVRASSKKSTSTKAPVKIEKKETTKTTVITTSAAKSTATSRKMKFDKKIVLPLAVLIIIAVAAYLASRYLVIAWVDKQPITRVEYYALLDKRYGKDLREQLIVQKLVESEAGKRHVTVTPQEVTAEIGKIEQQQGGASQLDQALQAQNIDRTDLNELVRLQLLRDKMFGSNVTVSDNDINNYMTQNKASLPTVDPTNASATATLKGQISDQLKQQKITDAFNTWLQSQLNTSRVIRL